MSEAADCITGPNDPTTEEVADLLRRIGLDLPREPNESISQYLKRSLERVAAHLGATLH
ncbi:MULTISPECIES: hypothetical protein [unclassified Chelatococcus]|uniref:hypothetical protein n=1 Tax=unclassified Chelatococcus TaxID=2638111 RepID=UPI001BCD0039|nr:MULTISPECIES: hypothetical protein [unclassified Chelatococcus]CAH1672388.1 hypothetical protein CHELA20_50914 [Hyphomicrobiales bacterium]MBS7738955.1 hypothetical protein [Chelatococcus sp. HY11]MBX3543388.1 hypothetical protein [Chelatococcus sp.]MCO5076516.1 hypothetical protein [Chelatococcus sp.]CAH1675380.1 hypothetical protein CHELA41_24099 [Hyphomicrobiales bacterium]